MAILKCKMCGGDLEIIAGATVGECEYCGTKQTLPRVCDERLNSFYERANDLRMSHEFDKSIEIYEKIIEENPTDADAYWSMVLCQYGIDYVEETKGGVRKPTINRAQLVSVFENVNYRSAIKYADTAQKHLYEEEAAQIDQILQRYIEISHREPPYDVFICYKETGADGNRTIDSVHAGEIYRELTTEGFKVFFAPVTLENKLGEDYEPYIFSAIQSAKVMIVIGTKPEHMNAVWVKNEWSRFLTMAKDDPKKTLIPVYSNMNPYDMPEAFRFKQSQNMEKIGFMLDLVRGIEKLVGKNTRQVINQAHIHTETPVATTSVDALLQRASIFLEDHDWDSANIYCEKVLDIVPTNGKAYLYKLLAEAQVTQEASLQTCNTPLENMNAYKHAVRYADESITAKLIDYNQTIKERLAQEKMAADHRQKRSTLTEAIDNTSSHITTKLHEQERLKSLLTEVHSKVVNSQLRKRKIAVFATLIWVNAFIIFYSFRLSGPGLFLICWILQFVFAIRLAGARGRSKVLAFISTLFTVGFLPIYAALKGFGEAKKVSINDLQAQQAAFNTSIQQLESEINRSRQFLNDLNSKLQELELSIDNE